MGVRLTKAVAHCHLGAALLTGANADTNIAVAGIKMTDEILLCWETATSTALFTEQTADTTITSDGNIQCGNATNNDILLLVWVSKE